MSLTANFRRQLDRLLAKSSPEEVLGRMRRKYGPGGKGGGGRRTVKLLRVMLKDLRLIGARPLGAGVDPGRVPIIVIVVVAETQSGRGQPRASCSRWSTRTRGRWPTRSSRSSRAPGRAGGRSGDGGAAGGGREQGAGDCSCCPPA